MQFLTYNPNTTTSYFYLRDHLGSIREMTDSTGAIKARYDYDPWGNRTKLSGSLDADFGFTGHYYHALSNLHLAPFRAYDPTLARWLSRDPLEEEDGVNLYAYVSGNPMNWIDPLGLQVDVNLFPPNQDIRNSANAVPSSGNYKVGGHGNPNIVVDQKGNPISAKNLAKIIKNDPNYKLGSPVDLLSCNTGKGKNPYGAQLAKELGAQVNAADNYVWYYPNGKTIVAPAKGGNLKNGPELTKAGKLVPFKP